jgi:pyridoxine/pyridoxamine 5'-phosphate oxidase
MSNKDLFVERRTQGDYAVRRANSERASATASTQAKAIAEAYRLEPKATVLVERVRYTNAGKPDKWRKP